MTFDDFIVSKQVGFQAFFMPRLWDSSDDYLFATNKVSCDLYFAGIKKASNQPASALHANHIMESVAKYEQVSAILKDGLNLIRINDLIKDDECCPQLLLTLFHKEEEHKEEFPLIKNHFILADVHRWSNSSTYWQLIGELFLREEDYWSAIASFFNSLEINPVGARKHFLIGCCYEKLGMIEEAVFHWVRIADSASAGLWVRLGKLYQDLGEFSKALYWFERCVDADPDNPLFIYK